MNATVSYSDCRRKYRVQYRSHLWYFQTLAQAQAFAAKFNK